MIQSTTLNTLALEKIAYGIADLKSDAKGVYRQGKRSVNLMKDIFAEQAGDFADAFLPDSRRDSLPFRTFTDDEIEFKNRRATKNMDSIVKQHGYQYQGDNTWVNPTTKKTFKLDNVRTGLSHTTGGGPHMMPNDSLALTNKMDKVLSKVTTPVYEHFNVPEDMRMSIGQATGATDIDTIRIGKRGSLRNKGTLMHEFGHHLQSPVVRKLDRAARVTATQAPRLAALNTVIGPFTYGLPATIAINKGLAATTAAAGATVAGSELQASYLGSKHLGKRIGHRARAFAGVPSYIAGGIMEAKQPLKPNAQPLKPNAQLLKKLVKLK